MVVCPAPDAWVEGSNEGGLVTTPLSVDEFFHLFQMTLLSLEAGFDDYLISPFAVMFSHHKLPDSETEEVKTCMAFMLIERVSDVGFAGLEGQPHFGQPVFGQIVRSLECGEVFAEDDEVICKADDGQSVPFGESCRDGGFEIV